MRKNCFFYGRQSKKKADFPGGEARLLWLTKVQRTAFAMACTLSFVFSGYSGIYSSQRILYDKLKAQYINVQTNDHYEGIKKE